jgi:hypothetical protein
MAGCSDLCRDRDIASWPRQVERKLNSLLVSSLSAESCIRKAEAERGLGTGLVSLADAKAEDEAATGTGFALRVD